MFRALAACILIASFAWPAHGSLSVGDRIVFRDGPGSPAGILHVGQVDNGFQACFDTLQVELRGCFDYCTPYIVAGAGLSTTHDNRELTPFTAWLYDAFIDQTLQKFDFAAPSANDANVLQFGIWKGMGYTEAEIECAVNDRCWYDVYNRLLSCKGWECEFARDTCWSGTGDIQILDVRRATGIDRAPNVLGRLAPPPAPGPSSVPEPTSVIAWLGLGLAVGLAAILQRRSPAV